jgi:hypothetical protein
MKECGVASGGPLVDDCEDRRRIELWRKCRKAHAEAARRRVRVRSCRLLILARKDEESGEENGAQIHVSELTRRDSHWFRM